jgi:RimJ/RimL family protein N-acetyltransferase
VRTVIFDAARVGPWVAEKVDPDYKDGDLAVGVEHDGVLVAGVLLNDFNGSNIHAHLRVDNPFGMNHDFLKEVFALVFEKMGARRMTAACDGTNERILLLLIKMGFSCEAILVDFLPAGALYVMVMWPEKCRYLEKKHG